MNPKYDAILGKLREADSGGGSTEDVKKEPILHLPLRENGDDAGKNHWIPYDQGEIVFADGWATFRQDRNYELSAIDFCKITMSANFKIPLNTMSANLLGMNADEPGASVFCFMQSYFSEFVLHLGSDAIFFQLEDAATNTPFHLAATYDFGCIHVYLNGILTGVYINTVHLLNPRFTIWGNPCKISDLRLYNTALNSAEIYDIYQSDGRHE